MNVSIGRKRQARSYSQVRSGARERNTSKLDRVKAKLVADTAVPVRRVTAPTKVFAPPAKIPKLSVLPVTPKGKALVNSPAQMSVPIASSSALVDSVSANSTATASSSNSQPVQSAQPVSTVQRGNFLSYYDVSVAVSNLSRETSEQIARRLCTGRGLPNEWQSYIEFVTDAIIESRVGVSNRLFRLIATTRDNDAFRQEIVNLADELSAHPRHPRV